MATRYPLVLSGTAIQELQSADQLSGNIADATYSSTMTITASVRTAMVATTGGNIDCSQGTFFTSTVNGNTTFAFSNAPSAVAYSFTLEVNHQSGTITWPTSVIWPNNTAPVLSTGRYHVFGFLTDTAGTYWRGSSLTNYTN